MYNQPEYDVTARRGGIAATLLYLVAITLAMWLTRCDTAPPTEEEQMSQGSILISFGNSEEGAGEVEKVEQIESESIPTPEPEPTPEPVPIPVPEAEPEQEPIPEPTPTDEQSDIEQLIPQEEQPPVEEVVEQPREVNKRALFPGTSAQSDVSQGENVEAKGVVGSQSGNDKSESQLGSGLSGDFDLAGRSLMGSLPIPRYESQQEGRVVINITVDEAGHVTSASLRATNSTTNNSTLIAAAREAALKARFSPSDSFIQSGTITYIFKLN